jgi:YjbE family integral membrane protein
MIEWLQAVSWAAVFQIILIDILLGGDNALVIALACRNLDPRRRMQGILWGTAGAIGLRVVLIGFALTLLTIPFLKIGGAVLLLWIGIKLLQHEEPDHTKIAGGSSLVSAVKTIIVADFVMSLDNILAIAGVAQSADASDQLGLVVLGLVVSVPVIIWGSTLLLKLIDRFPLVVLLGAGLLGWIAGGMIVTDVVVLNQFGEVPTGTKLAAELVGALLVMGLGRYLAGRAAQKADQGHT